MKFSQSKDGEEDWPWGWCVYFLWFEAAWHWCEFCCSQITAKQILFPQVCLKIIAVLWSSLQVTIKKSTANQVCNQIFQPHRIKITHSKCFMIIWWCVLEENTSRHEETTFSSACSYWIKTDLSIYLSETGQTGLSWQWLLKTVSS